MDILYVVKRVLTEPHAFFKNVGKGKEHLGFAFGYFAVLSLFETLFSIFVGLFFLNFIRSLLPASTLFFQGGMSAFDASLLMRNDLFSYVLGLGLGFVAAGLLHIWILLFGGKNSYVKTYELGAYAGTPALLLGWVPLLGLVGQIWSLILLIIGTQEVHGIARTKAIWMCVLPVALLFVLAFFAMFFFLFTFGSVFSSALLGGFSN